MRNPLIVLTFEGLTPAALSCYGSSWNHSPVIDSIAGSGAVWDRCLASSDDPKTTFHRMVEHLLVDFSGSPRNGIRDSGVRDTEAVELLTDDPTIAKGPGNRYFDQIDVVQDALATDDPTASTDIVNTQLGRLFASVIERNAHGPPWSLLWVHSGFLTQRWDAPRVGWPLIDPDDITDPLVAPIDPAASDGGDRAWATAVAAQARCNFESVAPPRFQLGDGDHPDLVTSWMRTYACQIQLLDLLLEMLIAALEDRVGQLVLAGTSGFRLGQGGWIGHKPPQQLRSRDLHVPMIYGRCDPNRFPGLTSTDVATTKIALVAPGGPLRTFSDEPVDSMITAESNRSVHNLTTPDWFYVCDPDSSQHLYSKPDDIDDFNDVVRIRPDIVSQLESAQKNSASQ